MGSPVDTAHELEAQARQQILQQQTENQALNERMRQNSNWGNSPTGAADDVRRLNNIGSSWADPNSPHFQRANADYANQRAGLAMAANAANGGAPSQAGILMQQGNNAADAANIAGAAGAHGQAGIGQAQTMGMGGLAAAQGRNVADAGAMRSQEMLRARDQYGQIAGGMREGSLGQAALAQKGQMGFENLGTGVNGSQLAANNAYEKLQQRQWEIQMGLDSGALDSSTGAYANLAGAVLGAGSGLASAGIQGRKGGANV